MDAIQGDHKLLLTISYCSGNTSTLTHDQCETAQKGLFVPCSYRAGFDAWLLTRMVSIGFQYSACDAKGAMSTKPRYRVASGKRGRHRFSHAIQVLRSAVAREAAA